MLISINMKLSARMKDGNPLRSPTVFLFLLILFLLHLHPLHPLFLFLWTLMRSPLPHPPLLALMANYLLLSMLLIFRRAYAFIVGNPAIWSTPASLTKLNMVTFPLWEKPSQRPFSSKVSGDGRNKIMFDLSHQ
jgi:hypothetical protein